MDISKHRAGDPKVASRQKARGTYVHTIGYAPGCMNFWMNSINSTGKSCEPFIRPMKEVIEHGLLDRDARLETDSVQVVNELGVDMFVNRRADDGSFLHQSDSSDYSWKQIVHTG